MAQNDQDDLSPEERKTPGRFTGPGLVVPLLILAIIAGYLYLLGSSPRKISYQQFVEQLKAKNVAEVVLLTRDAVGKFKQPVPAEATAENRKREGEPPADPSANREGETPAESPEKKVPGKKTAKAEQKPELSFPV